MTRPDDSDYLAQLDVWLADLTQARARRRRLWAAWASTLVELVVVTGLTFTLLWLVTR